MQDWNSISCWGNLEEYRKRFVDTLEWQCIKFGLDPYAFIVKLVKGVDEVF